MSYCYATTKSGQPCRAHHVSGSLYCFWHEPLYEDAWRLASMKGGSATLEDMEKKRQIREQRREILARLEQALAAAANLGLPRLK
jgi:hypothetical protein